MTKTIALALVAALAAGTTASAATTSGFGLQRTADSASTINLDLVRSDTGGSVQILDYSNGGKGEVLGGKPLNVGANLDVRINLERKPFSDVMAVLYDADGNQVAQQRLVLND